MKPKETLMEFDEYLAVRKLTFEAIVIGGAALAILGVVSRETQDCDVLDPNIPPEVANAAREFSLEILNPGWPAHVEIQIAKLALRLGYGT